MMTMFWLVNVITLIALCTAAGGKIPPPPTMPVVSVHKCCESFEVMVNSRCRHHNETDSNVWSPVFSDAQGHDNIQVLRFKLVIGVPQCGPRQQFSIYHLPSSPDRLVLLPNGHLRHYYLQNAHENSDRLWEEEISDDQRFYDYEQGLYCLDKAVQEDGQPDIQFAIVCNPQVPTSWQNSDFILRRIVDPTFHVIALACYLTVAIVHFVLPQLRDLIGNIITTMSVCLAVGQTADTVRIFTEFTSHTSYFIADVIMHMSLLGAFFWLNSAGYYIWKTFRSRNVFLRITDGRKYCYYSAYVWTFTLSMTLFALFAHFMLDTRTTSKHHTQGALGWLGVAVFCIPIASTILVNIFFYVTTIQIINRMSTYGRIHHKMKYSFETFVKLFLVMTLCWLILLLLSLPASSVYYCYIFSNALQAPIILYISVFGQKRVRFLLRKACCYEKCIFPCCRPQENVGTEWGEEMMAMNQ